MIGTEPTELRGKVVLLTGASSGIGEGAARRLAAEGCRLVLGARRADRLSALADALGKGKDVVWKETDVTRRADMEALGALAMDRFGRIDVLINNAGIAYIGPMADDRVEEWEKVVDVNIKGVLYGIHAALPVMVAQGSGHIINISSIGSRNVTANTAVYSATKFAVTAITEGLRKELAGKIRVTAIIPGGVQTEMTNKAGRLFATPMLSPDNIADGIVYALRLPPEVVVNELLLRPIYEG